ncbi:MAG: AAA family ATPase, partial [Neobacillus sp.]
MNQQIVLNNQLINWEKELHEKGFITDENTLINALSFETNPVILSQLLVLAAYSRIGQKKGDSLAQVWMEKAIELDPSNKKAKEFLIQDDWKKKQDILGILTFPSIRETDNRTAKKKIAEQYIEICQTFLADADDHLHDLSAILDQVSPSVNNDLYAQIKRLTDLLASAIETTVNLLKAAEEYEQSITGVFHTSTYYE